ncbi:MAG: SURF1 family cytochrome oxidase biogenesis protein [Marmoricola sp.]
MGFLLSRRWALFFLTVIVLALGAVRLGDWQFHRLDERRADNRRITRNLAAPPVPASAVLAAGRGAQLADEWRKVTASGTWDDRSTVVVRYRTRDEKPGVDVVTPLVTSSGAAVLVDRGWMGAQNNGSDRPRTPSPTKGSVTVTGYVRLDATGDATTVDGLSVRAISSRTIGEVVPYPVYGGFLLLTSQAPRASDGLGGPELPEIDDGPHFFYGLQWWFFGLLAVVGFCYLAFDEYQQRRAPKPSSERPEGTTVDREHHAAHE